MDCSARLWSLEVALQSDVVQPDLFVVVHLSLEQHLEHSQPVEFVLLRLPMQPALIIECQLHGLRAFVVLIVFEVDVVPFVVP